MATRQQICRIQVLAENSPILANSSTRQNGLFRKSFRLARLEFAKMWPFVVLAKLEFAKIFGNYDKFGKFGKFGEFGEFMENKIDHLEHTK